MTESKTQGYGTEWIAQTQDTHFQLIPIRGEKIAQRYQKRELGNHQIKVRPQLKNPLSEKMISNYYCPLSRLKFRCESPSFESPLPWHSPRLRGRAPGTGELPRRKGGALSPQIRQDAPGVVLIRRFSPLRGRNSKMAWRGWVGSRGWVGERVVGWMGG